MFQAIRKSKALAILALAGASTQLVACSSEEVAAAIGVGAIIGGAVLIGSNTECQAGYRTSCHDYVDYWGRVQRECREVYDSCATLVPRRGGGGGMMMSEALATGSAVTGASAVSLAEEVATSVAWSEKFGLSFDASEKFLTAMKAAREGNIDAVNELGLNSIDAQRVASFQMPSLTGVEAVARTLEQSRDTVKAMFKSLLESAKKNSALIKANIKTE